jgi:hypothetical protein
LNDQNGKSRPRIAINALGAAYILTRAPVSGTVAVKGVRARINVIYILFMALPLLFILPLLLFFVASGPPPSSVPRAVSDLLVLAKEQDTFPRWSRPDCPYPPQSKKMQLNIIRGGRGGAVNVKHCGLATADDDKLGFVETSSKRLRGKREQSDDHAVDHHHSPLSAKTAAPPERPRDQWQDKMGDPVEALTWDEASTEAAV